MVKITVKKDCGNAPKILFLKDYLQRQGKVLGRCIEKIYLTGQNDTTSLKVTVDAEEEFEQMFHDWFTKGLQAVKELVEQ